MPKNYHKLVHDGYNDDSKRGVKMNNKKLCKTIEKLQEGLNFARAELKKLRENNERYMDNLTERELLLAEKEKEIFGYIEKINKLVEENKELAKRNEELRLTLLDVGELKAQVEEDSNRMDSLDVFLDDLLDEINQVKTEESYLQAVTEELIEDIDGLENSTFGFSEAAYNSLPKTTKTEFKRKAREAIELRLVDIKVIVDELKDKFGELQAKYNWICERRQKMQLEGKL